MFIIWTFLFSNRDHTPYKASSESEYSEGETEFEQLINITDGITSRDLNAKAWVELVSYLL